MSAELVQTYDQLLLSPEEELFRRLEDMLVDAEAMLTPPEVERLQELDALATERLEEGETVEDFIEATEHKAENEPVTTMSAKPGGRRDFIAVAAGKA